MIVSQEVPNRFSRFLIYDTAEIGYYMSEYSQNFNHLIKIYIQCTIQNSQTSERFCCLLYMRLLIPRSIMGSLYGGFVLVPTVAMFGFLFHVVWGLCVKCKSTFTAFLSCYFWSGTCQSSYACKGSLCPMSGSRLGLLTWGGIVQVHYVVSVRHTVYASYWGHL